MGDRNFRLLTCHNEKFKPARQVVEVFMWKIGLCSGMGERQNPSR